MMISRFSDCVEAEGDHFSWEPPLVRSVMSDNHKGRVITETTYVVVPLKTERAVRSFVSFDTTTCHWWQPFRWHSSSSEIV